MEERIIAARIFVAVVFSIYGSLCLSADMKGIDMLDREVMQLEGLWKSGRHVEYYNRAETLSKEIIADSTRTNLSGIAAKLFGNLISKEVKIEEAGLDDLLTTEELASYLV